MSSFLMYAYVQGRIKNAVPAFAAGLLLILFSAAATLGQARKPQSENRTLVVIFDGMRPDYITKELMPNLYAFREKASRAENHHSVFPTVTRVNSASFATGSYPGTHGLLGNAVYFPGVNAGRAIGTSHGDLSKVAASESGRLLTGVSLGEVLDSEGERMMVFSSGTSGQAFLQNHTVGKGAVVNPGLILPESFREPLIAEIGDPKKAAAGLHKHRWVTDGLLKYGLVENGPLVCTIWFSDPDGAGHQGGIGSELQKEALAYVDTQFGRILRHLDSAGIREKYNIIATTDHGFVTYTGKQRLVDLLIREGVKKGEDSDDVILAEGAIYVKNRDEAHIRRIVEVLHRTPWIGAVFTRASEPGGMKGWVPGTFSFNAVHYYHPERTGDILAAVNWNDEKNENGYAGSDFSVGTAGHGGSSPYEIGIRLMAEGPDFKKGHVSATPSSIIDITPTVLAIYGYKIPSVMNGRVLTELLKSGKSPGKEKKEQVKVETEYPWGNYRLTLDLSVLGSYRYFNYSKTERLTK